MPGGAVRIVSGALRGRRVETPPGTGTRPLLTRLRKALADTLRPRLAGARVLDLFAGSGAIAFELLSNGAAFAVAVEKEPSVADGIARNARGLGVADRVRIVPADACEAVPRLACEGERFDVVVVAPPYGLGLQGRAVAALARHGLVTPGGVVVVQRDRREPRPDPAGPLVPVRTRTYGRTAFDYLENAPAGETDGRQGEEHT